MRRKVKKRLTIVGIILLWLILVVYVNIFPPKSQFIFAGFYFLLFLTLVSTLRVFFSFRRSLLWTIFVLVFLVLRQAHLDNILNTILLIGLLITLDLYLKNA